MSRGRGRSHLALVPLVALAAAWIALHATRPRIWNRVPGGHAAGALVVAAVALGVLATTLHLARRLLAGRPTYRRLAWAAFPVVAAVLAMAQGIVELGSTAPGWGQVDVVSSYGPLTIWPALWAAVPELGVYVVAPLGRVLVLAATAAALAVAATVALARRRGGAAADVGPGSEGALSAGAACALATSACPACAPPLASGLVALFGAGSVGPWLAPLSTPGSLASEVVAASSPLLALGALLVAAGPGDDPDDTGPDRGTWLVVGGSVVAGALLALPLAGLSPMPIGGTPQARDVAALYAIVHWVGLAVLVAFELLLVGLVVLNLGNDEARRRDPRERVRDLWLSAWIAVPVAILVVVAVPGVSVLYEHSGAPGGETYEVDVLAVSWAWGFTHPDGNTTFNTLRVPQGATVNLRVESEDVIHSVFVPDLGVKVDAVPGRVNEETFVADTPGSYRGACAEFCGIGHPGMDFDVVVTSPEKTPAGR